MLPSQAGQARCWDLLLGKWVRVSWAAYLNWYDWKYNCGNLQVWSIFKYILHSVRPFDSNAKKFHKKYRSVDISLHIIFLRILKIYIFYSSFFIHGLCKSRTWMFRKKIERQMLIYDHIDKKRSNTYPPYEHYHWIIFKMK